MVNIGYHTRLDTDNSVKVTGGCFGGSFGWETAERLVNVHFTVRIKPSGTAVFVDKQGRDVRLYMSVDAAKTAKGRQALEAYREEQAAREKEAEEREEREKAEIDDLISGMPHEEVLRRLKAL